MNFVDRHLVLLDKVPNYRIGHMLRARQACLSGKVRVPGYLDHIALLAPQLRRDLVQRLLGAGVQDSLTGAETKLSVLDL